MESFWFPGLIRKYLESLKGDIGKTQDIPTCILAIRFTDWALRYFNHTSIFSEPWNGSPSRFDSHIIHYAGRGAFPDKGKRSRVQLIRDDIKKTYGEDIE